jgi:hypothetical protein
MDRAVRYRGPRGRRVTCGGSAAPTYCHVTDDEPHKADSLACTHTTGTPAGTTDSQPASGVEAQTA